jgi:hypothetical protein
MNMAPGHGRATIFVQSVNSTGFAPYFESCEDFGGRLVYLR